ncbi:PREDICTED: uncharacterized protein LOC108966481 [Bactrocera latifrons]|uniref:uncharacterized protein LOC108966481 n=1 Tax=Bactrocera latifrons TaxID=174628 RepID=UPI0008DD68D9|nr:PREDICTED: uncharacterized protein LOC108966481 [Bactrocera latifrons]
MAQGHTRLSPGNEIDSLSGLNLVQFVKRGYVRKRLGPSTDERGTSTTILPPTVTTTLSVPLVNNATVNNSASNSNITSIYDQKHKILLVVLSDVNVRHIKDPQQAFDIGQSSTISNNADDQSSNDTLTIDATMLKEILKKLQPSKKCVNIVPQFVPPTFPWLIRKEQRKPITYIEPILCENIEDERIVLMGTLPDNQKRQRSEPIKSNTGYSRTRSSKNTRQRQRSKQRTGSAKKSQQLPLSLSNFRHLDYEHDSAFDNDWSNFSSEEN